MEQELQRMIQTLANENKSLKKKIVELEGQLVTEQALRREKV